LGGRNFRPRPVSKAIEEMESIKNNRLFIVDNSLAQDKNWLRELFTAMIPLKKTWVSHPILDDDEILKLAADSGCWYVYQAIFDTSNHIRNRIKRLKDHGIAIEGTIILGTDEQDEDYIKRLVDFLLEVKLDMAEFTIMTPFPHSTTRAKWEKEGRVTSNNWLDYTADKVVFKPKRMSAEKLQEMYQYAWDRFYQGSGHSTKMGMLFKQAMVKEMAAGTYRRFEPENRVAWRG
ncbi:MAG: radical protein, partial [Myxococcaceae bacterium]|nr:radical protein [Myxococcaceae bacterium]